MRVREREKNKTRVFFADFIRSCLCFFWDFFFFFSFLFFATEKRKDTLKFIYKKRVHIECERREKKKFWEERSGIFLFFSFFIGGVFSSGARKKYNRRALFSSSSSRSLFFAISSLFELRERDERR